MSPKLVRYSFRLATLASIRAMVACTTGARASRISSSRCMGIAARSISPLSIPSATSWGPIPSSAMALPIRRAAPSLKMLFWVRCSTTTLGMGTSTSLIPSMPSRRHTVRSTATVVCRSMKRWVSSATLRAEVRAFSTKTWSSPILDVICDFLSQKIKRSLPFVSIVGKNKKKGKPF